MCVLEDLAKRIEAIESKLLKENNCYVRDVPDTWEEHEEFHRYMKMYERMTREQSIEYAKKYLGPRPAKVVVHMVDVVVTDDENED